MLNTSANRRRKPALLLTIFCLATFGAILGFVLYEFHYTVFAQEWEPSIRAFEREDKIHPVQPGAIVFTGSSSIAYWESLQEDMKPLSVINRGFGGSEYTDVIQYAGRIVIAYRPAAVVVYAGDNDLASPGRKTPESVAQNVQQFVQIVHARLPQTWIYVISIKPSILRWKAWPQMKEANELIQAFLRTQDHAAYIDVATPMFGKDGLPSSDLFISDRLHPSPRCYTLWTSIIKPILLARFAAAPRTSQYSAPRPTRDQANGAASVQ